MKPKQLKVTEDNALYIKWENGEENKIELKRLRDECPCANCKGETVLLKTYKPPKLHIASPEMYIITNIQKVGNYAIQISWKDGHNTGIYNWDTLYNIANEADSQEYNKLL